MKPYHLPIIPNALVRGIQNIYDVLIWRGEESVTTFSIKNQLRKFSNLCQFATMVGKHYFGVLKRLERLEIGSKCSLIEV